MTVQAMSFCQFPLVTLCHAFRPGLMRHVRTCWKETCCKCEGVARTDLSLPLGQLPLEPEPRKEAHREALVCQQVCIFGQSRTFECDFTSRVVSVVKNM